eukprot:m.96482 g.96482  ORF g.96482 m.96482 type:complete len:282 (+) comp15192_c1_seq3:2261-3106(+)
MSAAEVAIEGYRWVLEQWSPWPTWTLFPPAVLCVHIIVLWPYALFLLACNRYRFSWFEPYRIQAGKVPEWALIKQAMFHEVYSTFVGTPTAMIGLGFISAMRGMDFSPDALPPLIEAVAVVAIWWLLFDTYFYWSHRLMHHKSLYQHIHKQHHRFYVPTGFAATYAHPVEEIFVNLASTIIGPVLFPSHFVVFLVYFATRLYETVDAHSGFSFPWSPWSLMYRAAQKHDFHHSHNQGNFGALIWDRFTGTDSKFKKFYKLGPFASDQKAANTAAAKKDKQQ